MKKILKNAFGFGLVEVLMAAGLAGGIALTIAKLSQDANRVTKTTETNNEINMFMTDAAYILSDKDNCMKTIVPGTAVSGAPITAVKKSVPIGASLPRVAYSFANGFDASSNTWSRKTIDQTAQQICDWILGATWNGTKCTLPTQSDVFAINVPAAGETRGNGATGNTFTTFMCPDGYGLAAVDARTGNNWDSITFQCRDMVSNYLNQTTSPRYGGSGGWSPGMSNSRCRCPGSSFISSIYMYTGSDTDGLSGDCVNKNFVYTGTFGRCGSSNGGAADTGRSICPPNSIANGAVVRYQSDRVNTVQLICQQKLTTVDW